MRWRVSIDSKGKGVFNDPRSFVRSLSLDLGRWIELPSRLRLAVPLTDSWAAPSAGMGCTYLWARRVAWQQIAAQRLL